MQVSQFRDFEEALLTNQHEITDVPAEELVGTLARHDDFHPLRCLLSQEIEREHAERADGHVQVIHDRLKLLFEILFGSRHHDVLGSDVLGHACRVCQLVVLSLYGKWQE